MADITFIVHKEWLENIKGLPIEQQDKIIADLVRYGTETQMVYEEDPFIVSIVNMLKGRIDYSKDKYSQKIESSKKAGRKKKFDDEEVYNLACQGKTSTEIAQIVGCSKSAIDHSEGWKRRKVNKNKVKDDFIF